MFQVLLLSCCLSWQLFQTCGVHAEGSKAKFDEILAKFGFTGLSDVSVHDAVHGVNDVLHGVDDKENEIQDNFITETDTFTRVKNGVFVIKVRSKHPIIRRKKLKTISNFYNDKKDLMFLTHLNERIQNPVFKSKYPERKIRRIR